MRPQMARVLQRFQIEVLLDTYELQSVNFVQTRVKVDSKPIKAVVQPANRDKLAVLNVDLTLRHIEVHAPEEITVGQYIVFQGQNYKVITPGDYQIYAFSDVICEETKGAIT